ncbi:outer membrane lipoprotein LolB [Candidatus Symbiobacter mobilis CR]|uniref:Outer-membrane lipoprotein LolB n=1 Tax=Candidatus Symbiobacter mobilis CR TaxID=946483 RepID=U5N6V1_9BURK|nr:outer membrane lipoprotein LolB [Candidatus Symbiobacter mobilis CR]
MLDAPQQWSGRLALRAQCPGSDNECPALAGGYELEGGVDRGALVFRSPLGIVLAELRWDQHGATRRVQGKTQHYDDVQAVVADTVAAGLPVAVLLDWLRGVPSPAMGWHVGGEQLLVARQEEPFVEVRVVPDRDALQVKERGTP